MNLASVPEDLRHQVVAGYLKGTASNLIRNCSSWKQLKEILTKNFVDIDYERTLRLKLKNLKQTESFEKYSQEFTAIESRRNIHYMYLITMRFILMFVFPALCFILFYSYMVN